VTGWSHGDAGINYATVKYNSNGDELWVARYVGSGADYASALALDADGNVYVSGWSADDASNYEFATIKYSQQ
jgi:hypothetical protein